MKMHESIESKVIGFSIAICAVCFALLAVVATIAVSLAVLK